MGAPFIDSLKFRYVLKAAAELLRGEPGRCGEPCQFGAVVEIPLLQAYHVLPCNPVLDGAGVYLADTGLPGGWVQYFVKVYGNYLVVLNAYEGVCPPFRKSKAAYPRFLVYSMSKALGGAQRTS